MGLEKIVGRTGWDKARFASSVLMDLAGYASYMGWFLGPVAVATEATDGPFAAIQSAYLMLAYLRWDSVGAAAIGGMEELLPGTDFVPTCTLYHIYVMRKKYGEQPVKAIEAR
jgi:hypothetical protein